MSDEAAKKGLAIAMVAGVLLGGLWALALGYSLLDLRAWNAAGLGVITTVSAFAVVAALRGYAQVRRAERGDAVSARPRT